MAKPNQEATTKYNPLEESYIPSNAQDDWSDKDKWGNDDFVSVEDYSPTTVDDTPLIDDNWNYDPGVGKKKFIDAEGKEVWTGQYTNVDKWNREQYGEGEGSIWSRSRDDYARFLTEGDITKELESTWDDWQEDDIYSSTDQRLGENVSYYDFELMKEHGVKPYGERNYNKGGPALWLQGKGSASKMSADDYYANELNRVRDLESKSLLKKAKKIGIEFDDEQTEYYSDLYSDRSSNEYDYSYTKLDELKQLIADEEANDAYPDSKNIFQKAVGLFKKD